ncbi:tapasin [Protopterus annectens]|uniref:tapasin n=1 Tax=Protopterus annectens TaxID=7888 RepID=UPI001CF97B5D|nr:tapasin [Protopterus annectens]
MNAIVFKLAIGAIGFFGAVCCDNSETVLGTVLDCWYVEEQGGRMGSFPTAITQKKSLLLLRKNEQIGAPLDFIPPNDVEQGLFFDINDPTGVIRNNNFHKSQKKNEKSACEINLYTPQAAFVDWTVYLTKNEVSPLHFGGVWYTSNIQAANKKFSISSIMKVISPSPGTSDDEGNHEQGALGTITSVALNVFTRNPNIKTRLSRDVILDCGFTAENSKEFSVEWRYQYKGSGHVVYAYDGVRDRVEIAQEGTQIFFEELHASGNASLLIRDVNIKHVGTYICTVYVPYLHSQQAIELEIIEPPQLSLTPNPVYVFPGREEKLSCDISRYYPLDVTIEWLTKSAAPGSESQYVNESWQTSHRQNSDGTYNVTSHIWIRPEMKDHETVFTCYVSHVSLKTGTKKTSVVKMAGASGPSIEDAIGMFITAFILYGFLKLIYWLLSSAFSSSSARSSDKEEKVKSS